MADQVPAVTASIEEHAYPAVVVPDHDDGLQSDLPAHEVSGIRNFGFVPDIDPYLVPDIGEFALEDFLAAVEAAVNPVFTDKVDDTPGRVSRHHVRTP